EVHEGQRVEAGQVLLRLDPTRQQAQLEAARGQAQRAREQLAELQAGPRSEAIAQARAGRDAARAQLAEAQSQYERVKSLAGRQLLPRSDLDRGRAALDSARARLEQATQALAVLEHGTRTEQLAQAEAALAAAEAEVADREALLAKLRPVAPRAGAADSLPCEAGDQAPPGAPRGVRLVGEASHARVYRPGELRARVKVGNRALVRIKGR